MKKFKLLFSKIMDSPIGFSLLSNIVILIIAIFGFRPYFETNDDLILSLIGEGAFGTRDYHLVYSHSILGRVVSYLASIAPGIRWYVVLEYTFSFLAFVLLVFILCHFEHGRLYSSVILLASFYEIYIAVQFTKVSALVAAIGFIGLIFVAKCRFVDSKSQVKELTGGGIAFITVLSYLLLLYAVLQRKESLLPAVVSVGIVGIFELFLTIERGTFLKELLRYCMFVAPFFAVVIVLGIVDSSVYNKDPEWNYLKYYNDMRTQMTDYHHDSLDYSRYANELAALGVSANDAVMYNTRQFDAQEIATPELMSNIAKISGSHKIDGDFFKALAADIYSDILEFNATALAFLFIISVFGLISAKRSCSSRMIGCCLAATLVMLFCCQYSGRWSHRTVYSFMMSLIISLIYVAATNDDAFFGKREDEVGKNGIKLSLKAVIIVLAVAGAAGRLGNEFDYREYQEREQNFGVLQMYMAEEKDTLFVADALTVQDMYKYDVFNALSEGSLDNFVTTGSWLSASPILRNLVAKYGYADPFDALLKGADKVILIDNCYPDQKATFLSEHGEGPRFAAEYIERAFGYSLYHIR